MPVKITTESAGDLSPEIAEEFDIGIVPMNIIVGGKVYKDGVSIKTNDVLRAKLPVTTGAVNPMQYKEFFSEYLKDGYRIVHIALSSAVSSTYQNALSASKELDGVFVVDSLNLSGGTGLLCIIASQLASSGMAAEKIVKIIEKRRKNVRTSFVLEDIDALRRGGRCSSLEAFGASFLAIKPSIEIVGGKLVQAKKYRGKTDAVHRKYLEKSITEQTDKSVCFLNHTLENDVQVSEIENLLLEKYGFERVFVNKAGCCISAHCGKNCMGVIRLE